MLFEKTLNSKWTVWRFCAGGTTSNIKLINSTKKTKQNRKSDNETGRDRQACSKNQLQHHHHHQKTSLLQVMHTHTHTHNVHPHETKKSAKNLQPSLFLFYNLSSLQLPSHLLLLQVVWLPAGCDEPEHRGRWQEQEMRTRPKSVFLGCFLFCFFLPILEAEPIDPWASWLGGVKSLQGGGRQLLDTPLSQEGTLDGLELWSGLGVLQGRVGGCHRTLHINKSTITFISISKMCSKIWRHRTVLLKMLAS